MENTLAICQGLSSPSVGHPRCLIDKAPRWAVPPQVFAAHTDGERLAQQLASPHNPASCDWCGVGCALVRFVRGG